MTSVPFGDAEEHATVLYDRQTQVCVVVANSLKYLSDAFAVVNSLKVGLVLVIAPVGTQYQYKLIVSPDREIYEYKK